ncbi:MAG: hypothetical protein QNK98_16160 [Yoonia sp.]|jgi:hypothetical protein
MKQSTTRNYAPPPQPTILGAAIFAAVVSFLIGVVLILMDLLLF